MDFVEKADQIRKNWSVQGTRLIGFYHVVFETAIAFLIQKVTDLYHPSYLISTLRKVPGVIKITDLN